jgi:hypothetical protein
LCAWVHKDDSLSAIKKAFKLIGAKAATGESPHTPFHNKYAIKPVVLILDRAGTNQISAMTIETLGYKVHYLNSLDGTTTTMIPGLKSIGDSTA